MAKQSLLETLVTNTTGKTYIDPETTQTIILDIAANMERKIASAEEQASEVVQDTNN